MVDIFPTLTELCGIAPKEGISGNSLVPLLSDPLLDWSNPVITSLGANHYSVRYQDWHYINYNGQEEELYMQKDDPEEWTNLAVDPAYDEMKMKLKGMIPKNRHALVKTDNVRWEDVLSGKTKMYKN